MLHLELARLVSQEQRRDWLAAAERNRYIAAACGPRAAWPRRMAAPLGRALVRLGAGLLRYGHAEAPAITQPYRASSRSIRLN
jgi:hypothetical protein